MLSDHVVDLDPVHDRIQPATSDELADLGLDGVDRGRPVAEQLDFTSVATTSPAQKAAVESSRQFVEASVVALGIPRSAAPATAGPPLRPVREGGHPDAARVVDARSYSLGPYREHVLEVGKGPQTVPLIVCSDIGARRSYDEATDTAKC